MMLKTHDEIDEIRHRLLPGSGASVFSIPRLGFTGWATFNFVYDNYVLCVIYHHCI